MSVIKMKWFAQSRVWVEGWNSLFDDHAVCPYRLDTRSRTEWFEGRREAVRTEREVRERFTGSDVVFLNESNSTPSEVDNLKKELHQAKTDRDVLQRDRDRFMRRTNEAVDVMIEVSKTLKKFVREGP